MLALDIKTADFTLRSGQRSLFDTDGSSLVVHSGPDDISTDPDGKAGRRIASRRDRQMNFRGQVRLTDTHRLVPRH
jgi:hypothetical protein